MTPPVTAVRFRNTCRLVPSRFPTVGILDAIAAPEDLEAIIELESWTNDRISTELGLVHRIPPDEWVTGKPMSSVIMAAFCHPRATGGRFNSSERGAWYAGRSLATAHAECAFHRTAELAEIGVFDARLELRLYLADFGAAFHDIRAPRREFAAWHDPVSYRASQELAKQLLDQGSNGIVYRSVRHSGGECLACFLPKLVRNVRVGGHFEYRWPGGPEPSIRKLG